MRDQDCGALFIISQRCVVPSHQRTLSLLVCRIHRTHLSLLSSDLYVFALFTFLPANKLCLSPFAIRGGRRPANLPLPTTPLRAVRVSRLLRSQKIKLAMWQRPRLLDDPFTTLSPETLPSTTFKWANRATLSSRFSRFRFTPLKIGVLLFILGSFVLVRDCISGSDVVVSHVNQQSICTYREAGFAS